MKHDQRLVEFYGRLGRRNGVSPEILLHEARVEFRRAWRRDLLEALFVGGGRSRPGASTKPGDRAGRLRLDMENAWLWLYYRVEVEGEAEPVPAAGRQARSSSAEAIASAANPIAAHILAAKHGRGPLPGLPSRESLSGLFARARAGGGEPGRDARYILGPR